MTARRLSKRYPQQRALGMARLLFSLARAIESHLVMLPRNLLERRILAPESQRLRDASRQNRENRRGLLTLPIALFRIQSPWVSNTA